MVHSGSVCSTSRRLHKGEKLEHDDVMVGLFDCDDLRTATMHREIKVITDMFATQAHLMWGIPSFRSIANVSLNFL